MAQTERAMVSPEVEYKMLSSSNHSGTAAIAKFGSSAAGM